MPRSDQAPNGAAIPRNDDAPVVLRPDVVMAYEAMIADVPEAGGDGFEAILEAVARAANVSDLDAPWRSSGLEEWANLPLRITGLKRMPSDYDGGLPFFLVVEAFEGIDGQKVTITTGAVSIVAQLAKAWSAGWFPLDVIPRKAARPSARGFYPMHLEVRR